MKMQQKIAGVENAGKENAAQDCRGGKSGKRLHGWKMREKKMQEKIAGVENAGKENAGKRPNADSKLCFSFCCFHVMSNVHYACLE